MFNKATSAILWTRKAYIINAEVTNNNDITLKFKINPTLTTQQCLDLIIPENNMNSKVGKVNGTYYNQTPRIIIEL